MAIGKTSSNTKPPLLFQTCFSSLKDYRRLDRGNIRYSLEEIIFLTISAVVSGCNTYEDIADFGVYKIEWLRKYYAYGHGIPSHDTLGEFYSKINPKTFGKCLIHFIQSIKKEAPQVVAIDGKTVKGFVNQSGYPLHILTAFCTSNSMSLGQEVVDTKENEISAIPRLLELICIEDTVVTIDAMGCQSHIAEQIIDNDGDYILQVKANQKGLMQDVKDSFLLKKSVAQDKMVDSGHGRVETRTCSVINDLGLIEYPEKWKGLKSLIRMDAEVYNKKTGETTQSTRYYISSLSADAGYINDSIRAHWAIESMHWILDVVFKEDNQAKRNEVAIENANLINKLALSLLKDEKSLKRSNPRKRRNALFYDTYREEILKV